MSSGGPHAQGTRARATAATGMNQRSSPHDCEALLEASVTA